MNRIPQSQDALQDQLSEQLAFLNKSAAAYDEGDHSEAKRLATHTRILLHDSATSHSLLGQLGLKKIGFFDTAGEIPATNLTTDWALLVMRVDASGARFVAPLASGPYGEGTPISFFPWWFKTVFRDKHRNELSRRDVVLAIANTDGGAHVDPELEERYAQLSRFNSLGWVHSSPTGPKPLPGPHLAAMRQIAHELVTSVDRRTEPVEVAWSPDVDIPRNAMCPCGSRRKFKKCCGSPVPRQGLRVPEKDHGS